MDGFGPAGRTTCGFGRRALRAHFASAADSNDRGRHETAIADGNL